MKLWRVSISLLFSSSEIYTPEQQKKSPAKKKNKRELTSVVIFSADNYRFSGFLIRSARSTTYGAI